MSFIEKPFPILENDKILREKVSQKTEIRFMEQSNGSIVCSYIISCDGTFDELYSREARGLVFDKNGNILSRPLHKFFNLNQTQDVNFKSLDWSKVSRIMNKMDGSMIHSVKAIDNIKSLNVDSNFTLKSKKSFESDVAISAREFMIKSDKKYIDLCNFCVDNNKTAIFEWTSPTARIVISYKFDDLVLLHIRDNITGEYSTRKELESLSKQYQVTLVDDYDNLLKSLKSEADFMKFIQETENVEGIIVQFENGEMVKVKTKWYCDRHGIMTNLRERDIAIMVLNESLDDIKAKLADEGCDLTEINEIENRLVLDIDEIINSVQLIFENIKNIDRKTVALKYSGAGENHPYFKLIMQKYEGKEPEYKSFYERNYLKDRFGLRQLNLLQSIAEGE